jgi:cytochrome c oxidase cbb3-type subunit 3
MKIYVICLALMAAGICADLEAAAAPPSTPSQERNPFAGKPEAIKEGEKLFDEKCAECHGGDAMGMSGPDLTDDKWIYGGTDREIFETVSGGRKGGMPSWRGQLTDDQVWKVISYVRSLARKK